MANNFISCVNVTDFFNKNLMMYSIGDIRFKTPISLKRVAYTIGFLIAWCGPLFFLFGLLINPYYLIVMIAPPFVAGYYSTKPIFAGKTLIPFVTTMAQYYSDPKGWTNFVSNNEMGRGVYRIENEIWISRRRERNILKNLSKEARS